MGRAESTLQADWLLGAEAGPEFKTLICLADPPCPPLILWLCGRRGLHRLPVLVRMASVRIREAQEGDCGAILRLIRVTLQAGYCRLGSRGRGGREGGLLGGEEERSPGAWGAFSCKCLTVCMLLGTCRI